MANKVARLLDKVQEAHDADVKALRDRIEELEKRLKEFEETNTAYVEESERLTNALESVKYWFLDVMAHKQPMKDPRKILRTVEDAL